MTAALLDACVLYSAPLRDLWMHLAVQFVFQPKWTARIQDEWIRNVLANRPDLQPEQLARTRECMERWGRDWEVPEYDAWLSQVSLPDPDDCHVLAAAVAGNLPLIVTFNLGDFPETALAPHGVRAVHPDTFASELLETDPEAFLVAVRTHRAALKNPPKSVDAYLETLRRSGLVRTVTLLQDYAAQL
jgi:PIN domain-containing protein